MSVNAGIYSYYAAALAYGVFTLLLLFSWRSGVSARLLIVASGVSTGWAVSAASVAEGTTLVLPYVTFEAIRYLVWFLFFYKLYQRSIEGGASPARWFLPGSTAFIVVIIINDTFHILGGAAIGLTTHLLLALLGLAVVEQMYRNTAMRYSWAVRYMFIGVGGIFAFDFYMYADALLFKGIDQVLWQSRGVVNLVAVPLIAISAARNRSWSLNLFVSRDVVLHTTAILGGGLYLLLMAAAGYYLKEFGGTWGELGRTLFFTLAVALLAAVLLSSQIRASVKVFLVKHFYKNKYDYRNEWLKLTEELGDASQSAEQYKLLIASLGNIVDARSGLLFVRDEMGKYSNIASWNTHQLDVDSQQNEQLVRFLSEKGYIVNCFEIPVKPYEYETLKLPRYFDSIHKPWLIIPLPGMDALAGFIVLADPLVERVINWEDRDLLKAAAKQVSSHIAVITTSAALAESKQFEVFTRLSAYMVHDLKNIAAELELVAKNATRHIDNKEFVQDAFSTVENAASDINRLLQQLRDRRAQAEKTVVVCLSDVVSSVAQARSETQPVPVVMNQCDDCFVHAEKNRLTNVLGHLVDNAQQATDDDGRVEISISKQDASYIIDIEDDGVGMEPDFIRDRLFKPFDTTKGNAGMGIGMYEGREFVRGLGGDMSVTSKPGQGTVVSLLIPAIEDEKNSLCHSN